MKSVFSIGMMNVGVKIARLAMCIFPGTMSRMYKTLNIKQRYQSLFGKNVTYLSLQRNIYHISHPVKYSLKIREVLLGFGIFGFQFTLSEDAILKKECKRIRNELERIVEEIIRIEDGIGRINICEGFSREAKEAEYFLSERNNLRKIDKLQFERQIEAMKMVYEKSRHFIEECVRIENIVLKLQDEYEELITERKSIKKQKELGNKELEEEYGFLGYRIEQHERFSKWLIGVEQFWDNARLAEKETVLLKQLEERLKEENEELRKYVFHDSPKKEEVLNALSDEQYESVQMLYGYFLSHADVTKANTKWNKDFVKYLERLLPFFKQKGSKLEKYLNM